MSEQGRLGLTLSGGGFRATLFHLGVVQYLRDAGLLRDVRRIISVSGGSILAAHLVLNWERYTGTRDEFEAAKREMLDFTQKDVRGRVVRRWLLAWLPPLIVVRPFMRGYWTFTNLLQGEFAQLYKKAKLKDFYPSKDGERPQVFIYSASLSTGVPYWFGRSGIFGWDEKDGERRLKAPDVPVALAVAASSAFPPLFPPLELRPKHLGRDRETEFRRQFFSDVQYLTDGGVYDNLGIQGLRHYRERRNDLDRVFVSDAEGKFDWNFRTRYGLVWTRNIRASDILMRRVSELQYDSLVASDTQRALINIDTELGDGATPLSMDEQALCRSTRTDLDAFTDEEITRLIAHGEAVARAEILSGSSTMGQPYVAPPRPSDPGWFRRWRLARAMRRTTRHQLRLWSSTDVVSWVNGFVVCMLGTIVAMLTYTYLVAPAAKVPELEAARDSLRAQRTGLEERTEDLVKRNQALKRALEPDSFVTGQEEEVDARKR